MAWGVWFRSLSDQPKVAHFCSWTRGGPSCPTAIAVALLPRPRKNDVSFNGRIGGPCVGALPTVKALRARHACTGPRNDRARIQIAVGLARPCNGLQAYGRASLGLGRHRLCEGVDIPAQMQLHPLIVTGPEGELAGVGVRRDLESDVTSGNADRERPLPCFRRKLRLTQTRTLTYRKVPRSTELDPHQPLSMPARCDAANDAGVGDSVGNDPIGYRRISPEVSDISRTSARHFDGLHPYRSLNYREKALNEENPSLCAIKERGRFESSR
jgi:hypothetical protein